MGAPDLSALQTAKSPQGNGVRILFWLFLQTHRPPDFNEMTLNPRYGLERLLRALYKNLLVLRAASSDRLGV